EREAVDGSGSLLQAIVHPHEEAHHATAQVLRIHVAVDEREAEPRAAISVLRVRATAALSINERAEQEGIDLELLGRAQQVPGPSLRPLAWPSPADRAQRLGEARRIDVGR